MLGLLVAVYNLNVGFLMHLSLEIPHVIQSHIWKKGWGEGTGGGGGETGGGGSTRDEMSVIQLQSDSPVRWTDWGGGGRSVRREACTL